MNERRLPLEKDVPKYKKKAHKKYLKRADHKHNYETVMLYYTCVIRGKQIEFSTPTSVCTVCGRIGYIDPDPSYYEEGENNKVNGKLSPKGMVLPKYTAEYFDKFAVKKEE